MSNGKRRYFPGANTGRGFIGHFEGIVPPWSEPHYTYVLKGGPGVGKSTLMKKCAAIARANGFTVEEFRCASDPESFDAVRIPQRRLVLLDGTAPHTMDVDFPAASGAYLDLGSFYDIRALRPELAHLRALKSTHQALYREAYRALHEAKAVHDEIEAVYHPHVDFGGVTALAERHIDALKKQNADCNRGEIVV